MITYFNNNFLPIEEAHISPFDRGFQFADGVYEVIRTYNNKLFLYEEHLSRLKRGLNELKINFDNPNDLEEIIYELIRRNEINTDANVYLQITRGSFFPRKHSFPPENTKPTIFISAGALINNRIENEKGVKVILENDIRWSRCDLKTILLLPSSIAKQKAIENDAYDAIWIRNKFIKEGSHTTFFAVKGEVLYTPPLSNYILAGITRQFIIDLCRKYNIIVVEEEIEADLLKNFNEFFITGTTTEIKPVVQIDDRIIINGKPGKLTRRIIDLFYKEVLG